MSFYKEAIFLFFILFYWSFGANAQKAVDSIKQGDHLSEVVVSATRSDRKLADVPIPVNIIGEEEIQSSGASRLDEILAEQTGLAIINDHGFGVQMQGMNPEYTLILINGEPVIGRTAGTLDLTRISLNDVQRIEIIKGPSSSLYGSDALAGVINIITAQSSRTSGLSLYSQYGTNRTTDNTITGTTALGKKGAVSLSANRYQTAGYDLMPKTYGQTVDPYTDYTFRGNLDYQLTPKLKLEVNGHYFTETQKNNYQANSTSGFIVIKGDGKVEDKRISTILTYKFSPTWKLKWRNYWTQYKTQSDLHEEKTDTAYDAEFFRQNMLKEELQSEHILSQNQILTVGTGFSNQSLRATRYTSKETLDNYFVYAQHEWHPTAKWSVLSGVRFDAPSAYHSQLSPKIAAQYLWNKHWKFQASVGMGYKAPDFRQLYLAFSNPIVGYSVLGTKAMAYGLTKMQQEGQIAKVFVNPDNHNTDLKPESSIAYNFGGSYHADKGWQVQANLFRNDIKDLIDTRVVAMKTNGQPLFSYYNIHRVFTQGAELNGSLPLLDKRLIIGAGYQFLIAKDKDVVEAIKKGEQFTRDPHTLVTRRLSMSEYGGLFNRSRNSFNVKVYYTYKSWSVNTRAIYRGRFGFADADGDMILDQKEEYAPGYVLCNLDLAKTFWSERVKIQGGVKDLLNYTDPQHLPYVPGRTWYIRASIHLSKVNQ